MKNVQLIANIKAECKKKNIAFGDMLEECGLSKGFMYDVEKRDRTPSIDKITVIADYLGVSIDYLLGRTDNPQGMTGDNITIRDIKGDNNTTICKEQIQNLQIDNTTAEFIHLFESLPISDRIEIMNCTLQKTKK